jgi:hypothetical protein
MTMPLSYAELMCKRNIAKGVWNKTQCVLCRKINKTICPILTEQNEYEEDKNRSPKDFHPTPEMANEERR